MYFYACYVPACPKFRNKSKDLGKCTRGVQVESKQSTFVCGSWKVRHKYHLSLAEVSNIHALYGIIIASHNLCKSSQGLTLSTISLVIIIIIIIIILCVGFQRRNEITELQLKMKDPIKGIAPENGEDSVKSSNSDRGKDVVLGLSNIPSIKLTSGIEETLSVVGIEDGMRSSSSSLAKSESSQDIGHHSALKNHRATSERKKISFIESPNLVIVKRERAETVSPLSDKNHRHSIINISADKRARKVKFYINGDKFFKGAVIAVNNEKFRTFDKLLEHMTKIMCNQVTLPNGVRFIFSLEGKIVLDIDCILNGESYVCSSFSTFKKLDYPSLAGQFKRRSYSKTFIQVHETGIFFCPPVSIGVPPILY